MQYLNSSVPTKKKDLRTKYTNIFLTMGMLRYPALPFKSLDTIIISLETI